MSFRLPPRRLERSLRRCRGSRCRCFAQDSLYLANKVRGEEFTAADQRAVELLAAFAATGLGQSVVRSERVRPTLDDQEVIFEARGRTTAALLDPMRLDQVLTNLLEDVATYSADGTTIRIGVAEADGGVEISVRDQGMGIAPDEVPKLFDRFCRTMRAREQKTGLGLVLYITKGFVEAHGGHISVESVPDRGSTFRVWFPTAPLAEDRAPRPGP